MHKLSQKIFINSNCPHLLIHYRYM